MRHNAFPLRYNMNSLSRLLQGPNEVVCTSAKHRVDVRDHSFNFGFSEILGFCRIYLAIFATPQGLKMEKGK